MPTTIDDFRAQLLRDTFDSSLSDRDAFLLFALFHYYQIEISGNVLTDRPNLGAGTRLAADTQRGCAAALSSLWQGTNDQRASYTYWYFRWNAELSYDAAEHLSADDRARLSELIAMLERHPDVTRFAPEDVDLITGDDV